MPTLLVYDYVGNVANEQKRVNTQQYTHEKSKILHNMQK